MPSEDQAQEFGRRFDHIVRARWFLGATHFVLGLVALFAVNLTLQAWEWDDWWYRPMRALHLRWVPPLSIPMIVYYSALLLPPAAYAGSWYLVKDSALEDTDGARFWFGIALYFALTCVTSIASDRLLIYLVQAPLNYWGFVTTTLGTFLVLKLNARFAEVVLALPHWTADT
jgi:hypothetical protein